MKLRAVHHLEIVTPKKVVLDALLLGPKKPKRVIVWVHGLGSTMFRKLGIMDHLVDSQTSVLTFNNRGHDKIARVTTTSGKSIKGGAAHEVFTDSRDDIEGAIRSARALGAKSIFLVGHSTGCQKSAYWASKKGKGVKAVFLLSPMSDRSSERMTSGKSKVERAEKVARELVRKNRAHEMLPERVWGWPWIADAQRFLSLYGGKGAEELFTYWDPKRDPRALRSIQLPTYVLLGEREEYADRPIEDIARWFKKHLKEKDRVVIIPKATHSFRGAEKTVAKMIGKFMKEV